MIMCLFSVYQPIHVNFFLCVVFNFRSCRPSWQPRNCLRDWRFLWGATLLTVAPWLPTERFTMKEPNSPQRKTDPGRPELGKPVWPWPWGKQALDLAIRTHQTGFSLQGQEFLREAKGLCMVWRHSWYPRLSSGNWMAGWESSLLICHSVRIGLSCFGVLRE